MSTFCLTWIITMSNLVGEPPPRGRAEARAVETCQLIVESAEAQDVPAELAVAVAFNESRLRWNLTSLEELRDQCRSSLGIGVPTAEAGGPRTVNTSSRAVI